MDGPTKTMERSLELPAVIAVSISAMLGSGIFVLPGLAAAETGASIWLSYLLSGLFVLPAAVSKSELATAMPTSGGSYVYLDRAFGPLAGTVAGLGLWLSLLLKSAFALVGMGAYLAVLTDASVKPVALLLAAAIVLVNIRGVKGVGQAQLAMVTVTVVALVALVVDGVLRFQPENLETSFPKGATGLFAATALVFVSYAGVTKVAAIAEEVRNPDRNLPLGILLSLIIVSAIYTGVTFVLVGNIPQAELAHDLRPIYTIAFQEGGAVVGLLAAVIGVLTMASMANAGLLAASRFPFAMSRENLLPPSLGYLHGKYLTPVVAIVASGLVVGAVVAFLDVERIAKLASSFVILIFVAENTTVIVLREARVQWYKPAYRGPFYPWLHGFGIVSGLILLFLLGSLVAAGVAVIIFPGLVLYFLYGRRRTVRMGVVAQRGPRQELLRGIDESIVTVQERPMEGADVLVPLFGRERSPEMLVQLGTALANGARTQVVHLTEIPEQTTLEAAIEEDDVAVTSLARRLAALSETAQVPVGFDAVVSRDIIKTVHQVGQDLHADWLVVEWGGRTSGLYTMSNPLGWLASHVSCNLAIFHDAGVRFIREILVYVEPGPHDSLVVDTADHLAKVHGAQLTFARFVPLGAALTAAQSAADYLDQVRQLSVVDSKTLLVKGADEAQAVARQTAAFDLLVMGAPPLSLRERIFGSARDRLTEDAACSVLRVQTPQSRTHEAFARRRDTSDFGRSYLMQFLDPYCVQVGIDGMRKDALFSHFAQTFAQVVDDVDAPVILAGLWERERMQNTSVGHGLALPHATIPTAGRTRLGIFTLKSPTNYQAPDGVEVDTFFVTLGPASDRQTHLKLLATVAKMVLGTTLVAQLRAAKSTQEILDAVEESAANLQN